MVKNAEAFYIPEPIGFENSRRDGIRLYGDITNTLQAFAGTGGGNGPCVAIQGNLIGRDKGGPQGIGVSEGETMYTLTKADVHGVAYGFTQCDAARDAGNNISPTLRSGGNGGYPSHSVAYGFEPGIARREGNPNRFIKELSPTLRANMGDNQIAAACVGVDTYNASESGDIAVTLTASGNSSTNSGPKVMQNMAVRRLTPVECERLQGFPDNYTNIKDKCPDGPRYKAMGNSMAVPVMRWIGERINKVNNLL
jgi:site-specific DNA-cytosine methylase